MLAILGYDIHVDTQRLRGIGMHLFQNFLCDLSFCEHSCLHVDDFPECRLCTTAEGTQCNHKALSLFETYLCLHQRYEIQCIQLVPEFSAAVLRQPDNFPSVEIRLAT